MTVALQAKDIRKTFSGIVALDDLDLTVEEGRARRADRTQRRRQDHVLQLRAGRAATRLRAPSSCTARTSAGCACTERASRGIGRTFQRIELFAELTVREHLLIAERVHRGDGRLWKDLIGRGQAAGRRDRAVRRGARRCSGWATSPTEPIEHLSLGKGRLVEVGRALMTQPTVLLLDEPSSGLDRQETADLARTLREVQAEQGFAILLVEHDVEFVAGFTERVLRPRLRLHDRPGPHRRGARRATSSGRRTSATWVSAS